MRSFLCFLVILAGALLLAPVAAQNNTITELCDGAVQARTADFEPGGIILTAFDGAALWVYDIERATRYPLPDTRPCLTNCRLAPDASWLIFPNPSNMVFTRMRLDGTQRESLYDNVTDMTWWTPDIYLIWTADHRAYLQPADNARPREEVPTRGVVSIQPAGPWGILIEQYEGEFWRTLVDLGTRNVSGVPSGNEARIYLAPDIPYFNAGVWSPDGTTFAFAAVADAPDAAGVVGAELSFVQAGNLPEVVTNFTTTTGALRIGGYNPASLHWSPDSRLLAFWGTPLTGADPVADAGEASIYILDAATRQVTHYCGFATTEHSPSPSRLIWSPDSTTLAFAGNVTGDDKGSLLLALDVATGKLTELSDGIFPALGLPDVVAWGHKP